MHSDTDLQKERILFVTLSNIGDLVMTTPVIRAIHKLYPNHTIDIVADRRSGMLLAPCPYVSDVIWKDKKQTWRERAQFIKRIRKKKYELAVDLRGPWLAWLARAKKVGLKKKRTENMHAVEHHFTAIANLDTGIAIPNAKLWLSEDAQKNVGKILGAPTSTSILALAPGANWPGKVWPYQAYSELVNLLADDFQEVLLLGGSDDYPLASKIASDSVIPTKNLCGVTSLTETAVCLSRATAFVGNDSGVGHMAAALDIPTMTVFGEGDPDRYRPWGSNAGIVLAPNKNLSRLSAEKVVFELKSHLANLDN